MAGWRDGDATDPGEYTWGRCRKCGELGQLPDSGIAGHCAPCSAEVNAARAAWAAGAASRAEEELNESRAAAVALDMAGYEIVSPGSPNDGEPVPDGAVATRRPDGRLVATWIVWPGTPRADVKWSIIAPRGAAASAARRAVLREM